MALRERYSTGASWYHSSICKFLAFGYYQALRRAMLACTDLRKFLCRCRFCRIYFLTTPSNRGREDLGCPFGCADSHRHTKSNKRSHEYYKTPEGKVKKKELNRRRGDSKAKQSVSKKERNSFIFYLHYIMTQIEHNRFLISAVEVQYQKYLKIVRQHSLEIDSIIWNIRDG